jgi:hypothetical protein
METSALLDWTLTDPYCFKEVAVASGIQRFGKTVRYLLVSADVLYVDTSGLNLLSDMVFNRL